MPINYDQKSVDQFFEDVHGIVEATSFEQSTLWKDHVKYDTPEYDRSTWIENYSGLFLVIDDIVVQVPDELEQNKFHLALQEMPITLSLTSALITHRGKTRKIVFWHSPSQIVDHRIIDQWFKDNLPCSAFRTDVDCPNRTDAINFYNIFRS